MKELKFRAWNEQSKHWYPAETMKDFFNYLSEKFSIIADWFNKDAIILEQYTGLKDKNGKEIYEGDIVECDYCNENHLISWCSNAACFESWRSDKTPCLMFGESHEELHYEVVGNIHENPDLYGKGGGED